VIHTTPEIAAKLGGMEQIVNGPAASGTYSVPVRIGGDNTNDPNLNGYETPNFIHKKEINLTGMPGMVQTPRQSIEEALKVDTQGYINKLNVCKNISDKAKVCKFTF
jgi:hypothetical protein